MRFLAGMVAGWGLATLYYTGKLAIQILDGVDYGPDYVDQAEQEWREIVAQLKNGKVTDNG